jgi:hypothetical protein
MTTRAFEVVSSYLGWGEHVGSIWFVGLEEADGWEDKSEGDVLAFYKDQGEVSPAIDHHDFAALRAKGRSIRNTMARILSCLSQAGRTHDWRWYRDHMLWRPGSQTFQANLFPLGKPSRASWPQSYKALFGYGVEDRAAYEQALTKKRFVRLGQLWSESRPRATICFGKEGWKHCRKIFRTDSSPAEVVQGKIYAYAPEHVILTPFFAYGHVTNQDADQVAQHLRDIWNVSIP